MEPFTEIVPGTWYVVSGNVEGYNGLHVFHLDGESQYRVELEVGQKPGDKRVVTNPRRYSFSEHLMTVHPRWEGGPSQYFKFFREGDDIFLSDRPDRFWKVERREEPLSFFLGFVDEKGVFARKVSLPAQTAADSQE